MDKLLKKILGFLKDIELAYYLEPIEGETFLPGLKLRNGVLIIDTERLLYPGDILHEAGHLACAFQNLRTHMDDTLENNDINQAGELMAIAWSYAACVHLNIDSAIVFHENGYKGAGQNIIENFRAGNAPGLPMLQWMGMSYDKENALKMNTEPFPAMLCWLCQKTDHI